MHASGPFVEVNCATLKGDSAMSALFGHRKGAFTGAAADRPGLLRTADKGVLFLDEIGALGLDEQAMILRAIEDKRFLPVDADKEARQRYVAFAMSPAASWPGNFRDLAASITRMATLSPKGRIDLDCVEAEIGRLKRLWSGQKDDGTGLLATFLGAGALAEIDPFDRVQLAETIRVCQASRSLSEAGRTLFSALRARKAKTNDADRLHKYLARFNLDWATATNA